MGRPKKRRIKRTIVALENLKGLLRIVASLIKNGQKKSLHSASQSRPPCVFCTICSKKVSCFHQAFVDVIRHCKTALHIKFKDEMNRQHKIEKPDDLLKKKYLCLNLDCSVINFDC